MLRGISFSSLVGAVSRYGNSIFLRAGSKSILGLGSGLYRLVKLDAVLGGSRVTRTTLHYSGPRSRALLFEFGLCNRMPRRRWGVTRGFVACEGGPLIHSKGRVCCNGVARACIVGLAILSRSNSNRPGGVGVRLLGDSAILDSGSHMIGRAAGSAVFSTLSFNFI